MLKVNFDAGQDHIGMFQPFVLDAVAQFGDDGLVVEDVRLEVRKRDNLSLPTNTLQTLLGRLVKDEYLVREGGRYFRTEKDINVTDIQEARRRTERRQRQLADALCFDAAEHDVHLRSTEEGLSAILQFLELHHVAIASPADADDENSPGFEAPGEDNVAQTQRREVVTARFLLDIASGDGELTEILQEMLEGFVLQNALLLKDISVAARRFNDLHVFVDSGLLFAALGLRGAPAETATLELIALLRETGAVLDVFEHTISEMRRVLAVYENRVGTSQGRLTLYPTDLTRHILSRQLTPSDIRTKSSLIDRDLRSLGFNLRERPEHVARWTLDEDKLGKLLAAKPGGEKDPRVVHDVDCIAGVITYRRGKTAASLDDAEAVFVTGSSLTVRNTNAWYATQGSGCSPIVHYLALSNFAWLKKPASAANLKLHELVALCSAALRPSRQTWQKFVAYLKQLEASGELTSDEVTAIVASDLTDRVLVDDGIDEDSDSASIAEVVERVKASYQAQTDAEIADARRVASEKDNEARALRLAIDTRARASARVMSWVLAGFLGLAFVVGAVLSIVAAGGDETPSTAALTLAIIPLVVAGLFGTLWGFHLRAWRQSVEDWLAGRLGEWLAVSD